MVSTSNATRAFLIAALAGSVGMGSYAMTTDANAPGGGANGEQGQPQAQTSEHGAPPAPFTTADQGACLTWNVAEDGSVTGFEQTDCAVEHRFEVASRQDLAIYPTSEFGQDAPMPNPTRQAQLREELCGASTLRYLEGKYDPNGRYSIAPILPPAAAWEAGDRTMLCGLQETNRAGEQLLTTGRVAEEDQARTFAPGECVAIDGANNATVVDCGQPHQMEITSKVDLAPVFPDGTPSVEDQDKYLGDACTEAAHTYLGSEENLYQISLQPFWTTQQPASWEGGSHSVNCALVFSSPDGGFSELTGSATGGREALLIDGTPPPERPQRRPLRENQTPAASSAPASPAPEAAPEAAPETVQ